MTTTVVIGAGIIGCSTAYFLCESGHTPAESIHLIEASPELFKCASGLAAGFVAKDCTSRTSTLNEGFIALTMQGSDRLSHLSAPSPSISIKP